MLILLGMEALPQNSSWLPLVSPAETEGDPSSPITILAQDYLDDPPVRDIPGAPPPLPASDRQQNGISVSTQKDTPAPPTEISQAIAATASAVASSVPLNQLQRSIDTFCSALLARADSKQPEPAQDRYSLRMIEDLDFIKYQLSSRERERAPPTPEREGPMREFQSEIRQLKLRLDEHGKFDRFLTPLSQLQQEVASLKTALESRGSPRHSSPPAVSQSNANVVTLPSNNLVIKECQTEASLPPEEKRAASVSIQTTSLPPQSRLRPRPRRPLPSPIRTSSPLSPPPHSRAPPNRLQHIESRLRAIQSSRRQIDLRAPPLQTLPLSDILQQVVQSSNDVTYRTHRLVSDKLESLRPAVTESVPVGRELKGAKPARGGGRSGRHEKDPVYLSRVYGNKKNLKETPQGDKPTQPDSSEITRVYKQIELIRSQMEQLSRHAETAIQHQPVSAQPVSAQLVSAHPVSAQLVSAHPVSAQLVSAPERHKSVPLQKHRAARLIRPPRLMPSPYSPPPPPPPPPPPHKETEPYEVIACEHAQVQTSFLSPSADCSPLREPVTSHESTLPPTDTLSELMPYQPTQEHVPPAATNETMDAVSPVETSQLLEQMISLQVIDTAPRGQQSPIETSAPPSDPLQLAWEQELGRRHLQERVHQLLVERATESVSDQIRLCQAREREQRERRLAAEVKGAITRDILTCIQAAREGLRADKEAVPAPEPEEEHTESEDATLSEGDYSLSFVSESDEASLHSSVQSLPQTERLSLSPFSPNSTLRSLPRPTSATQRFAPSPPSPLFPLPISPHSLLTPLSPELPFSAVNAEVQCDMANRTLPSPVPSSPASTVHTATTPPPTDRESAVHTPTPPPPQPAHLSVETQCDLSTNPLPLPSSTPIPRPSPIHAGTQCDPETAPSPLPLPLLYQIPKLPADTQAQYDDMFPSVSVSDLLSYTETDSSSRATDPSCLSEGEYVPPRRHRPSSELSLGEVPHYHRLSPAVEAALRLKSLPPDSDPSPGEYLPEHPLTPKLGVGTFSPVASNSPIGPTHPSNPCPPDVTSLGELAAPNSGESGRRLSDSDHLSQSVTLSIAFSSPSNKTTTRHRDGVDVFDVSDLEGLSVPPGWEQSEPSGTGDTGCSQEAPRPDTPAFQQPHHQFDTPHLDKSNNSTTCDVHSLESAT